MLVVVGASEISQRAGEGADNNLYAGWVTPRVTDLRLPTPFTQTIDMLMK